MHHRYVFRASGRIVVRCMVDVAPGEELTLAYTDLAQPRVRRRHDLRERFGFTCECERCGPADPMLPASSAPFSATPEGQDPAAGYAAGASACADDRRQAHAAKDSSGHRVVPVPDWFLSAVTPGGWGSTCLQLLHQQPPAVPSPAGLADAAPAVGSAGCSQHAASCAAAAPGHERGAPPAQLVGERPFAAVSPSELAAAAPGAAGVDLCSAAVADAAARSPDRRDSAPGPMSPLGAVEAEAALARAVAAGAAALLECGDAQRACATLQDGLLQAVRAGVHPYHHRCLDLYSCLASACRVAGKRGCGAPALRWAALARLLHAGAVESLLAAREYSCMAAAAQFWAEAGAALCECLAAELAAARASASGSDGAGACPSEPHAKRRALDASNGRPSAEPAGAMACERAGAGRAAAAQPASLPCRSSGAQARAGAELAGAPGQLWQEGPPAAGGERGVPGQPPGFAGALRGAWAALASAMAAVACRGAAGRQGGATGDAPASMEGVSAEGAAWSPADFACLGWPAGFHAGPEAALPAADALLEALRSALPAHKAMDRDRLAALALGAVHCTARAAALAHVALGSEHALAESSAFAAFFAGLPYPLAAAVLQGASMLGL